MIHPTVWIVWLSDVAASHFENSLSAASIAGSLTVGRSQGVAQLLTVRQRHSLQEAARLAVTKRRVGKAPEGSGVAVGTGYHWYILAHQNVTKLNANEFTTSMTGM